MPALTLLIFKSKFLLPIGPETHSSKAFTETIQLPWWFQTWSEHTEDQDSKAPSIDLTVSS